MKRLFAIITVAAPLTALAGGYAVSEQDAAATGRAGTGTAALLGASSVHYNPANLSRLFAIDAAIGGAGIVPLASAADPQTGDRDAAKVGFKTPPHVYAGYGNGKYGFALGLNTPFGGGIRWGDDFRGRFEIIEQNLQVFGLHAGAAYQLLPELSVGATVTGYRASIGVEKRIDFVDSEGTALLQGGGMGLGAALGVSYAPSEKLRMGLTARLPANIPLSGRAHFKDVPDSFGPMLQDQSIEATLPIPGRIAAGVGIFFEGMRLFVDADYTLWSAFDTFRVDFQESDSLDVAQPRNWKNAFSARVGVEKDLSDVTMVRGGLLFDQRASPAATLTPSTPDSDRVGASLGVGRDFGPVRADAAYMFVLFVPRTSEGDAFAARYTASAHILALTLGFSTPPGVASRTADTSTNRPLLNADE